MLTLDDAHISDVNVISWNRIEPLIVSGGDDGYLKVWDLRQFKVRFFRVIRYWYSIRSYYHLLHLFIERFGRGNVQTSYGTSNNCRMASK